ncbi:hydroxyethylthiazole kinase [Desulfoluna spongiiphila]|uniref:hydroxyethylthiazole kinase n=1 Tax=Desulfoluna spongiiphila TaxID=419481 RepID=UPI00125BAC37|nr:hydroxyethylthiazole kinase [Desulfoluna spongiiphila]VVS91590.1 hydroxyethylthiazole kinase [Desulfoluna spongiiphila]
MNDLALKAAENLSRIRESNPLVHNITNYVVMNYTANALLSLGASPVMAHAENEVEEMVSFAGALVLNIGTLSDPWIRAMITAGARARAMGTPVILDPVGSGATTLRTRTATRIIREAGVTLIRGNASEILSLQQEGSGTRGVDAVDTVADAANMASDLATELGVTIAITGPEDIVTDGTRTARILGGHPLMAKVTGTGCTATAIAGAFAAVDPDPFTAGCSALAFFGLAGQRAGEQASAPGSFMIALLDALYTLTPEELKSECHIDVLPPAETAGETGKLSR